MFVLLDHNFHQVVVVIHLVEGLQPEVAAVTAKKNSAKTLCPLPPWLKNILYLPQKTQGSPPA
jgi:hypothetical protein